MEVSTLFKIKTTDLSSEAEVETRFLSKLFYDLGYPDNSIVPKKKLPTLFVNDGSKKNKVEVDFLLFGSDGNAKVVVEAKDPTKSVNDAWGQAASYALSYNRNKKNCEKIKWLLITNGYITSVFKWDSDIPLVTARLQDFSSGSPAYTNIRSYIKYKTADEIILDKLKFDIIPVDTLNKLFSETHDYIWKKEKLNPTDAFFEFCKFVFIKIREDKKRENIKENVQKYMIPLTKEWLIAQNASSSHPIRDILFKKLKDDLETAIKKDKKRRIFDINEKFLLSASTCEFLIEKFQNVNLSSIDEDLNGRMFEVFLNSAVRGKALGQYFTPRTVVDFMTRIALFGKDVSNPPRVIDGCSGTAGFLIEIMAYLLSGLREDTRFTNFEKEKLSKNICNNQLFGIEANERVARIARINMYLHGDGGSHIFHGDGLLDKNILTEDMDDEKRSEIKLMNEEIKDNSFDIILSNPPFSMSYKRSKKNKEIKSEEDIILEQREIANGNNSAKSNILFLDRYWKLLIEGGELLIVIDDTVLNGSNQNFVREWLLKKFIIIGVHSLPFNSFFKAKANIKTSILHLRKKKNKSEEQGYIFMSISNNIGHDNSLRDTLDKNNLNDILQYYFEWKRTGFLKTVIKNNQNENENLECPEQIWILEPEKLKVERLDAFFYSPELNNIRLELIELEKAGKIDLINTKSLRRKLKINSEKKKKLKEKIVNYIEISDITEDGYPKSFLTDTFERIPSRGQYIIEENDILMAINISSRGTTFLTPKSLEGYICTSGFWVFKPENFNQSLLLWYSLRSKYCKKQIYYLAQTASQPELKKETWENHFLLPIPKNDLKDKAIKASKSFISSLNVLITSKDVRLDF